MRIWAHACEADIDSSRQELFYYSGFFMILCIILSEIIFCMKPNDTMPLLLYMRALCSWMSRFVSSENRYHVTLQHLSFSSINLLNGTKWGIWRSHQCSTWHWLDLVRGLVTRLGISKSSESVKVRTNGDKRQRCLNVGTSRASHVPYFNSLSCIR